MRLKAYRYHRILFFLFFFLDFTLLIVDMICLNCDCWYALATARRVACAARP